MEAFSTQDSASSNACDAGILSRKRRLASPPPPDDSKEEATSQGSEMINLSDFEAGSTQRSNTLECLIQQICTFDSNPSPPLTPEKIFKASDQPEFKVPLSSKRVTKVRITLPKDEDGKKKRRRLQLVGKLDHKLIRRGADIEQLNSDFFQEKDLMRDLVLQLETGKCVTLARSNSNRQEMTVVKVFNEMGKDGRLKDHERFAIETGILKHARHHNIVSLGSVIQCPEYYAITRPYYPGGDLLKHLQNIQDTNMVLHYFTQICRALLYLHTNRIVHGNVNLENVLVQHGGKNVVMTGFGQAHLLPPDSSLVSSWQGKHVCGFKMESYSLGVLLWYVAVRDDPELSEKEYSPDLLRNGWPVPIHAFINYGKLLCRFVTSNPRKRSTVHDLTQYFNERMTGKR